VTDKKTRYLLYAASIRVRSLVLILTKYTPQKSATPFFDIELSEKQTIYNFLAKKSFPGEA